MGRTAADDTVGRVLTLKDYVQGSESSPPRTHRECSSRHSCFLRMKNYRFNQYY